MNLSISTCWNSHRQEDGYAMLAELKDLGFAQVELSHGIRLSLIPGILKGVDEGLVQISSVHNFCPLPPGVMGAAPNLYEPTARNKIERSLWKAHTLKSIDFARRVGAQLVVVHSGSIRWLWGNPEPAFDRVRGREGVDPSKVNEARAKAMKKIRGKRQKYMARLRESLLEVIPRAVEMGIRLGLENREGLVELPLDEDWPDLLEALGEPETVGYWHDSGHAQLKERMGVFQHKDLLEANRDRQFGFHLHDVSVDDKDHQSPGSGVIDWQMVKQFVQANDLVVMEMSPRLRSEEIRKGRQFLEELLEI